MNSLKQANYYVGRILMSQIKPSLDSLIGSQAAY